MQMLSAKLAARLRVRQKLPNANGEQILILSLGRVPGIQIREISLRSEMRQMLLALVAVKSADDDHKNPANWEGSGGEPAR